MKQPAIVSCVLGFIVGVGAASFGWLWLGGATIGLLGLVVGRKLSWVAILACLAGGLRIWLAPLSPPAGDVSELAGQPVKLSGQIVGYPEVREGKQRAAAEVSGEGRQGKVLLHTEPYPELRPGDRVSLSGAPSRPENFDGFDYRAYLAKDGIHTQLRYPQLVVTGATQPVSRRLYGIRQSFIAALGRAIPEPEASFITGILLGERSGLPQSLQDAFQRTGTLHVLALSGYNISVILGVAIACFGRRPWAIGVSLFSLAAFILLVGPSASVVRAGLMGGFLLIGQALGRPQAAIQGCLAMGALMLLIAPWSLRYDLGFDLSFLATLGILTLYPGILRRLSRWPRLLRAPLAVTLAASLPTAPLILLSFGTVSMVSPLANLVVVPLIPWLMLGGFLTVVAGFLYAPLAAGLALLTAWLARLVLQAVEALSVWPLASITVTAWQPILAGGLALVIGWWWYRLTRPADA